MEAASIANTRRRALCQQRAVLASKTLQRIKTVKKASVLGYVLAGKRAKPGRNDHDADTARGKVWPFRTA